VIRDLEIDHPRITLQSAAVQSPSAGKASRIIADAVYPNMYRVTLPDGSLSDIVNYARAIDACPDLAETASLPQSPAAEELVSDAGEPLPLEDGIPDFLRRFRFDQAAE
jgi:hypothetical protein